VIVLDFGFDIAL